MKFGGGVLGPGVHSSMCKWDDRWWWCVYDRKGRRGRERRLVGWLLVGVHEGRWETDSINVQKDSYTWGESKQEQKRRGCSMEEVYVTKEEGTRADDNITKSKESTQQRRCPAG